MLHEYKPDSPYRRFMPPMVGTEQDVDDLTDFLNAQVNPPGRKPRSRYKRRRSSGSGAAELAALDPTASFLDSLTFSLFHSHAV